MLSGRDEGKIEERGGEQRADRVREGNKKNEGQ